MPVTHISDDDQGKKWFKLPLSFSPILFLLCFHNISTLFQSIWFWGFIPGIAWALDRSVNCYNMQKAFPLAMHHNRCKRLLELPIEIIPAAQHKNYWKCLKNMGFPRKKLCRTFQDAKKDTICSELQQQAVDVAYSLAVIIGPICLHDHKTHEYVLGQRTVSKEEFRK